MNKIYKYSELIVAVLVFFSIVSGILKTGDNLKDIKNESVSILSYNIRFDRADKPVPSEENEWVNRKDHLISLIQLHSPDFFGLQEDLLHQLNEIDGRFEDYDWVGVGRYDGKEGGEFCSIHYNSTRFELIENRIIWLSETPEEPSASWDGSSPRILNYGKFRNRSSGKEFYVFNTHFDHAGQKAREGSAKLIRQMINELPNDVPFIIMGDFNITEENIVYEILTTGESMLKDAFNTSDYPHVGPLFTREGFEVNSRSKKRRIDYIFVSENIQVKKHAIISSFRNGYYPSDHLPVYTEVDLKD